MPDISDRVEFLLAGEFSSFQVSGLFAEMSGPDEDGDGMIEVRGELGGSSVMPSDATLQCIVNDEQGRISANMSHYIDADSYIGFEVFEFTHFGSVSSGVSRIRIVMKPA